MDAEDLENEYKSNWMVLVQTSKFSEITNWIKIYIQTIVRQLSLHNK